MFDIVFFSRVVSLLPIDGLIKSEAVVLVVSVSPLKFQDNPECNSVLPFRIILKIFAVNMLLKVCVGVLSFSFCIKIIIKKVHYSLFNRQLSVLRKYPGILSDI